MLCQWKHRLDKLQRHKPLLGEFWLTTGPIALCSHKNTLVTEKMVQLRPATAKARVAGLKPVSMGIVLGKGAGRILRHVSLWQTLFSRGDLSCIDAGLSKVCVETI